MRDPNDPCLFCNSKESGIIIKNHLAYASYDTYPVSKYHCLIIPKRHMKNFFDLTNEELVACNDLIKAVKKDILNKDPDVEGFNLGAIDYVTKPFKLTLFVIMIIKALKA